jgi:hypothetical protein
MYPWDKTAADAAGAGPAEAADTRRPGPASDAEPRPAANGQPWPAIDAGQPGPAIGAVQVALDRRDNGGDAAAPSRTPTASPARQ